MRLQVGEKNIKNSEIYPNTKFHSGGLESFISQNSITKFTHFINLVNIVLYFNNKTSSK